MNKTMKTLSAATLLAMSGAASAAPMQMSLVGTVTIADGAWASYVGTTVNTTLVFDLDENNAYAKETIAPIGEDPYTRWTFTGSPYQATFTGAFGTLSDGTIRQETQDNFDADANGNPYGVTGVVDALSLFGSSMVVDCSAGTVDPVTGCSDPNAPWLSGMEFSVDIANASNWFAGMDVLPGSIPAFGDLVGVFGWGERVGDGAGTMEIQYSSMSVSSVSSVPVPAAAWLFGSGLAGLVGAARRRKSA